LGWARADGCRSRVKDEEDLVNKERNGKKGGGTTLIDQADRQAKSDRSGAHGSINRVVAGRAKKG